MKSELYAVIDIGSNSVRLMFSDGVNTLSKEIKITGLAEGALEEGRILTAEAAARTIDAVCFFVEKAGRAGADKIYAFATAAVRNAENGKEFVNTVKSRCGIDVEVISGEKEAAVGIRGALGGKDGGVIDVGGASTEVIVIKSGKTVFCNSFKIGSVKLTDMCGQDYEKAIKTVKDYTVECKSAPRSEFTAIGGTSTSAAAMLQELEIYDPKRVDGYVISVDKLEKLTERLFSMSVEERAGLKGLQRGREKVIACGCALLSVVSRSLGANTIKISEKDNLEGYLYEKLESEKF